jgi:hypothetical protein
MIARSAGRGGPHAGKAEGCEIQFVDKRIDDAGRVIVRDVIVQAIRKSVNFVTICSFDKACYPKSPLEKKPKTKRIRSNLYS